MHVEHFFTALHSAHSLRLEPVFYPRLRSSLYIYNFTYTNVAYMYEQLHSLYLHQLMLPECVHIFSLIVSTSAAAPRLYPLVITHTQHKL